MAFTMTLWNVEGDKLHEVSSHKLEAEKRLEDWIENDPSLLGLDLLIIGRQVPTPGRRLDLLALDSEGNPVIIELKKDKTARETVAQVLDYGAWISGLTRQAIAEIAANYLQKPIQDAFKEHFDADLLDVYDGDSSDVIGDDHGMVIVASELDDSSERIVQYLSSVHFLDINVVFFNCFQHNGVELVGRSWLIDLEEVEERAISRGGNSWSGFWFVNVGEGDHRSWDDCRNYGFLSAGFGRP
jgi:hypothetical protein